MSEEDAGAPSKTYRKLACDISTNGHIVIKSRPCKVTKILTLKTNKNGPSKKRFVGIDIFNGKTHEDIVPWLGNCDVPYINHTDYQLINISEDGSVSLTENGKPKNGLRLPTDEDLVSQIKDGFLVSQFREVLEGVHVKVSVMSAMGEEKICGMQVVPPNNE